MSSAYITLINNDSVVDMGWDHYLVDASANSISLTFDTIISDGMSFIIARIDTNASNTVTAVGESGELIDGNAIISLEVGQKVKLVSYNGQWYTVLGDWS